MMRIISGVLGVGLIGALLLLSGCSLIIKKSELGDHLPKVDDLVYRSYMSYFEPDRLRRILIAEDTVVEAVQRRVGRRPERINFIWRIPFENQVIRGDSIWFRATFFCDSHAEEQLSRIGEVEFIEQNKVQVIFPLKDLLSISKLPFVDSIDYKTVPLLEPAELHLPKVDDLVYYCYLHFYDPDQLDRIQKYKNWGHAVPEPVPENGFVTVRYFFSPYFIMAWNLIFKNDDGDNIQLKARFHYDSCSQELLESIAEVETFRQNQAQVIFSLKDLLSITKLPCIDSIDLQLPPQIELTVPIQPPVEWQNR